MTWHDENYEYAILYLFDGIGFCSPDMFNYHRRGNVNAALGNFFFIVPLLVFEIMLTKKLDYQYFGSLGKKIWLGSTAEPRYNSPIGTWKICLLYQGYFYKEVKLKGYDAIETE